MIWLIIIIYPAKYYYENMIWLDITILYAAKSLVNFMVMWRQLAG